MNGAAKGNGAAPDLGAWLRTVTFGTPACVFCNDTEDTRDTLEELATSEANPSRVVTLTWRDVPPLSNELELLVAALAKTTLSSHPVLYGRDLALGPEGTLLTIDDAARSITRALPGVHGPACKRILSDCARQVVPKLGRMASAEQVRQFALAIDPERLLVVITIQQAPAERLRLRSLAQGAEWLAANTRSRVVLVLPLVLRALSELDHVTYVSCVFADAPENENTPVDGEGRAGTAAHHSARSDAKGVARSEPMVGLSPIVGKPHGDAEQSLYDHLTKDDELRDLFAYNQHVVTCSGLSPIVDLLWKDGKLVIEIDGESHRRPKQFSVDRQRDYWLMMSGYRVLRFTNSKIYEQCDEVVDMIRNAVHYLGSRERKS